MNRTPLWKALGILLLLATGAWATAGISVEVDGRPLVFDQPPVSREGRLLVPLRGIFEALGAQVEWDAPTRTVRARSASSEMLLPLGSRTATVDGRTVTLDVPADVVGGRTLVPLRFVAEALGAEVRWDGPARRVTIASGGAPPPPEEAGPAPGPSGFDPALDLPRIQVGNQAGLLKLLDRQRQRVEWFRTLDDRTTAPVTAQQRAELWTRLGVEPGQVPEVARRVMEGYNRLPRLPGLALLGFLGSTPQAELGVDLAGRLQQFAASRLASEKDGVLRRQAVLALALMSSATPATVEAVTRFFETEGNLWVTFPVSMFFEYHGSEIRGLAEAPRLRARIAAVPSLYTADVLKYLGPTEGVGLRTARSEAVQDLSGRSLATLPPELVAQEQVRQLSLADNGLAELPADLGDLRGLEALVASGNHLRELPANLAGLRSLRYLDLSGNQISELPAGLVLPASLKVLGLRNNRLARLPADPSRLRGLEVLELDGNPLDPAEVGRLRKALPGTWISF